MDYSELLKDPRWQKKRLEIFERDGWTCLSCDRKDLTLHIHHLMYFKEAMPWEYENCYLVTYCELCHNTDHLIGTKISESLFDIVKQNTLYVKPLANLCILTEKFDGFYPMLKKFLNGAMISYLQTKKLPSEKEESIKG